MRAVFSTLVAGGLLIAGCATAPALSTSQGTPAPAAPAPMPSHEAGRTSAPPSGEAKPNAAPVQAPRPNPLRQLIAGKEDQPAETIFKNIQVLKGVPAGRFLDTMEGFSHALGTNCKKCHDTENFASDDKDEKKIARGMVQMTRDINQKYIKTMPGLDSDAFVSCNSCHHGHSNPNFKEGEPEHEHHG